jgi:hypothetical protein
MKKILFPFMVLLILSAVTDTQAQRRRQNEPFEKERPERLDKYRKMRLVEILNLQEEDAIRYFAKEDAHRENMHKIMGERNGALDELDRVVRDEKESPELEKYIVRVREIDRQITAERERFQDELKNLLTPVQFGKFLIFERNFGNRLRDAFDELHKESRQRPIE